MLTLRFSTQDDPQKKSEAKNLVSLSHSSTYEIAKHSRESKKMGKCDLCSGRCDAVPAGGLQVEHASHHQLRERVPPQGASHQSQGQKVQPKFFNTKF
jgi:hypothetical protein